MQFDYAPDYKYYQSDVTRVFPADGMFTPRQSEFYAIYLQLYQALMTSIACTPRRGTSSRRGAQRWTRSWRVVYLHRSEDQGGGRRFRREATANSSANSLGHCGRAWRCTTSAAARHARARARSSQSSRRCGFADEHIGIRLEDMILITETGYENLSAFVPIEIAAIEATMKEPGLQKK